MDPNSISMCRAVDDRLQLSECQFSSRRSSSQPACMYEWWHAKNFYQSDRCHVASAGGVKRCDECISVHPSSSREGVSPCNLQHLHTIQIAMWHSPESSWIPSNASNIYWKGESLHRPKGSSLSLSLSREEMRRRGLQPDYAISSATVARSALMVR